MSEQDTPVAVEPVNGAGLTDQDPPQTVTQDPTVAIVGDLDALPEEL